MDRMGLASYADTRVAELSTGTRRVVELACSLALEPTVLLLDEPSSGIAQREAEALGPLIRRIHDELGCAVLLIEHDMPLVMNVAPRLVAMELGAVIADGRPDAVVNHPQVVASYLGTDQSVIARSGTTTTRRQPRRRRARS